MRKLTVDEFFARATPVGECLIWQGSLNADGYGSVKWRRQVWLAHRLAHTLVVGPIPDGLSVLHSCDTPACIRPAHLSLGTHVDNMRDAAAKGRNVMQRRPKTLAGERNPAARLTADDVRMIRNLAGIGARHRDLADLYAVSKSHIDDVVAKRRWAHV